MDHTQTATPDTQAIGLIVPPADGAVPPDGLRMYPQLRFLARGLALGSIDRQGYDGVIDHVVQKARELAQAGACAVSLMGTSLSFYRGANLNQRLIDEMSQATGLRCTTMSSAILRGMRKLDMRSVAVATAYVDDVNQRLAAFLDSEEVGVASMQGLGINDVAEVSRVSTQTLVQLCARAWNASRSKADGILLSCGGLVALDAVLQVERELGVPVVASSPAGFWDVAGAAGVGGTPAGYGRLAATAWR